ncbi:phosphotransferase [Hoyosella sp. YIM 151337]|uniref:maltokinase N-terminal cap-like domain-containing protein n=1 Tax=Hoyosella sp. YIM 151337 TaxID=2992742 RepID=UPI002236516B|nr:phosphotransferase [Hoyosella sp. YIM 151337]MCW4352212.1 phosphotransferase [Hoyosella sp. YIM 151337]
MTADSIIRSLLQPLREWLPRQRWFASKNQAVDTIEPLTSAWLYEGDPGVLHALVNVHQQGRDETYQLVLGVSREPGDHVEVIARTGALSVFDAAAEPALMARLLDLFASGANCDGVVFQLEPGVGLDTGLRARAVAAEQSNTSLIFGDAYILKLYRRPHPGPQRDLELHRLLHSAGSKHIAAPLGNIHAGDTVLGFLQNYLPYATEGWAAATASVRDLMAERDLHASEVGGDFAGEARRLGAVVATVHADLARAGGSVTASSQQVSDVAASMHARLDNVLEQVPEVGEHEQVVRAAFDDLKDLPLTLQHVHGDLHLGQTLRTTTGWVLIDFEGEPAATMEDRSALSSPLRDVAGMLRSFDYAAHHLLVGEASERGEHQREVRANEWAERNRAAFIEGYAAVGGVETGAADTHAVLRAFELDKVVYEAGYERRNRPLWLPIPLAALMRLAGG